MTDEEMAEEYAVENWEHYEEGQTDYKALKQAFLAGLKAGRPKWHKVADGDLPEEDKSIMIYAKLADGVAVGKRRKQGKVYEWYFATYDGTFCLRDKEVIAWKELVSPKEQNND